MIWKELLLSAVRFLLGILAGWLMRSKIIDADLADRLLNQGAQDIVGWLVVGAGLLWIWFKNRRQAAAVKTALALPAGTTLAELKSELPLTWWQRVRRKIAGIILAD